MKNLVTSVVAASMMLVGQAIANPAFDNHANYGSVLQDTAAAQGGVNNQRNGHLAAASDSDDSQGVMLYDLDQNGNLVASQRSTGDGADDFGNILFDTGSVY